MPIIKSAKKRVRTATKAAVRNSKTKRHLRVALKLFASKPKSDTKNSAQSAVDTAVKKGIMHPNKAARLKKRMSAQAKAAGVKSTVAKSQSSKAKTTSSKSAAKTKAEKTTTPPAKKSVAKKTPAKKTAAASKTKK